MNSSRGSALAQPGGTSFSTLTACSVAFSIASALAVPAYAQDAQASRRNDRSDDEVQEIVVTGSHIASATGDAFVPLQIESRVELEAFGAAQISDAFKAIPSNSGSEMFTEAQPRAGVTQFNLRGLGYTSTLTLINGRRGGVAPLSDETGAEFTDINQFPLAMIDRVEVLKDGASAIYGSDAVAGVVNLITRRGFEGFELSGGAQSAANESWSVNLASGKQFDGGSFNLYATYYGQTGTDRTDFDWLVERIHGNGVLGRSQLLNSTGYPSNYRVATFNPNGQPIPLAGAVASPDVDCEAAGGVFRVRADGSVDRSQCLYNFADQVGIIPSARRLQVFAEMQYALTERAKVFGEASFSRNTLTSTRGPGTFANGSTVGTGAGNVFIPSSHPFNFYIQDPANPQRLVYIGPENWNPAIHTAANLTVSTRPLGQQYNGDGAGERRSQTNYTRIVGGLDYQLTDDWKGTLSYQFAGADFSDLQQLRYRADVLNQLILSGQFNPFGSAVVSPGLVSPKDGTSTAANSEAIIDQFITDSNDTASSEQQVIDFVATGKLLELPGGALGVAFGAQYRETKLEDIPDALQSAGRGDQPSFDFSVSGQQDVVAAFGELSAPLGSRASVQLAARFEDYGGKVGSSVDPKLAARYSPVDGLVLRASWSTSFQAPTLAQLSESLSRLFIDDPTTVVGDTLVCRNSGRTSNALVRTSGGDQLNPQSSTNYNFGVVLQPLERLELSVDYWNYRYEDLIAAGVDAQSIVNADCADDGIPNDPRVIRGGDSFVGEVLTSFVNVGEVDTDGLDFTALSRFNLGGLGRLEASLDATHLRRFDVVSGNGSVFDGAGSRNAANNFRSMPKWRGVASLRWMRDSHAASVNLRYIDSYRNDAVTANNAKIPSYATLDVSYAYSFDLLAEDATTVAVGADNVFDRDPPGLRRLNADGSFAGYERPGYDAYAGHDLRGRILWLRATQEF